MIDEIIVMSRSENALKWIPRLPTTYETKELTQTSYESATESLALTGTKSDRNDGVTG